MSTLFDPSLYSFWSVVGWVWSALAFYLMFSQTGQAILSRRSSAVIFLLTLIPSIWLVSTQVSALATLAGGLTPLDAHLWYGSSDIREFAQALGENGRQQYAVFQLGIDALAPPAFVCFLMSVFHSTIRSAEVVKGLRVVAFVYLVSVLVANTLMPVIVLNFPEQHTALLSTLYVALPILDGVKYASHMLCWFVILSCWLLQSVSFLRAKQP